MWKNNDTNKSSKYTTSTIDFQIHNNEWNHIWKQEILANIAQIVNKTTTMWRHVKSKRKNVTTMEAINQP
jgi:hypothetical protein